MAGRRQKSPDQLQDARPSRVDEQVVLPAEDALVAATDTPAPPSRLLKGTKEKWELFWTSPLREYVIGVDRIIIERYFRTLDINDRAYARFMRNPYDEGSTGQERAAPAWQVYRESSRLLDSLEDQLGIGARSRMRLNIMLGEAAESMADFLAALRRPTLDDDGPGETYTIDEDGNLVDGPD